MSACFVTGEADFVLTVTMRDMADYERFQREFLYRHAEVRDIRTLVVIDRVKTGFALPIDENAYAKP